MLVGEKILLQGVAHACDPNRMRTYANGSLNTQVVHTTKYAKLQLLVLTLMAHRSPS